MKLEDALEICKTKLCGSEPQLRGRVKGVIPYDDLRAKRISTRYESSLSSAKEETISLLVAGVLDKLRELKDGFWMSEPGPDARVDDDGRQAGTVRVGDLILTLACQYRVNDNSSRVEVLCWYHPGF